MALSSGLLGFPVIVSLLVPQAGLNSYGKLTSHHGRWSARILDAGRVSHRRSRQIKRDMHAWGRAATDGLVCYRETAVWGPPRGSLAACAQSCRAKSLGLGHVRWPTKTQLKSTQLSVVSIQSSSPRFCTKTSGGLGLVQGWGAGAQSWQGQGSHPGTPLPCQGLPMSGSRSSSILLSIHSRTAQYHTSLARVPGRRRAGRAVQSSSFPQAGLLHS